MVSARDIMRTSPLVTASPGDTIASAVKMMHENRVGSVIIVEDSIIKGIFTERDLVRVVATGVPLDTPLEKVMTRDVVTAKPDESIAVIASRMIEKEIRHIPVADEEGRLLGVISIRDVLRHVVASSSWP